MHVRICKLKACKRWIGSESMNRICHTPFRLSEPGNREGRQTGGSSGGEVGGGLEGWRNAGGKMWQLTVTKSQTQHRQIWKRDPIKAKHE